MEGVRACESRERTALHIKTMPGSSGLANPPRCQARRNQMTPPRPTWRTDAIPWSERNVEGPGR